MSNEKTLPEQQAQAGEPEVVAWMRTGSSDGSPVVTEALLKRAPEYRSEYEEALITLQSHRAAIAAYARRNVVITQMLEREQESLAKRDAALQACVEALRGSAGFEERGNAIEQAKGAMK